MVDDFFVEDKRRMEKVKFEFDNPGNVEIEAPVMKEKNTGEIFFHPDDVDEVLDKLDKEYDRVHKELEKSKK